MYIDINSSNAQIWTFEDPLHGIHVDKSNLMTLDYSETEIVTTQNLFDKRK